LHSQGARVTGRKNHSHAGTRAYTRAINKATAAARKKSVTDRTPITLSKEIRRDLEFLRPHILKWQHIGLPLPSTTTDVTQHTDAGEFGYGGHMDSDSKAHAATLPAEVIGKSSTYREFYGLIQTTLHFIHDLQGKRVRFVLDSNPLVRNLLNEGGRVTELTSLWKQWMEIIHTHTIEPMYEWRPREENTRADKLSKQVPLQWSLARIAEDIITRNFPNVVWMLPDLNQISNTLKKAQEAASATAQPTSLLIIHPVWPASPWWNKVTSNLIDYVDLPPASQTLLSTKAGRAGPPDWQMRASLLGFTPSRL
jgi:hypothetical protein